MFTMFLEDPLHSPCALLSHYKWLNKVSNLKIHGWFCSHCLIKTIHRSVMTDERPSYCSLCCVGSVETFAIIV